MRRTAAAALLVLAGSMAHAQTTTVFNRTGSGARAAGMANAFIAVSDDGTAASWNPAGLGQLRSLELSAVVTVSGRSLQSSGFRTRDDLSVYTPYGSQYSTAYLDFASLALPLTVAKRPVTLQASWRSQYDLDNHENDETIRMPVSPLGPPRTLVDANADVAGNIDILSLAGAVKLTSRVALGASFNRWRGSWTEDVTSSETQLDPPSASLFTSTAQSTSLDGHSLGAGVLFTYPRFNVGLVYQHPVHGDFDSEITAHVSDAIDPSPSAVHGGIRLPRAVGGGVSFHPAPRWTVAADVTWDQWTDTLVEPPDAQPINLFDGLPRELSATRDTVSANVGAEWLLEGDGFIVPVRFGVGFEPQGPRDPYTRDPVDFRLVAAGTGYNTNSLKFDAAVQYRWSRFRDGAGFSARERDELMPSALGERAVRDWRLKFSLILRATDGEKLRSVLRRVFGG